MLKIKKQLHSLLTVSALGSFQIAGASWVALLSARGFSLVEIGLAESCFHLTSLLFELPSGVISDVFGRKRSMILSQCMFVLSALGMIFSSSLFGVCLSLILDALGYNFASGTREALAYESLKAAGQEERYLEFSSLEFTLYRIGNAGAVLCAGFALLIGYRAAYLLDFLLGAVCLFFAFRLTEVHPLPAAAAASCGPRTPAGVCKAAAEQIPACFRESISFLIHSASSLRLMFLNAFVGSVSTLTVFYLQATLEQSALPDALLGLLLFAVSLGGAAGAKMTVHFSGWRYRTLFLLSLLAVLLGVLSELSAAVPLMCLGGFCSCFFDDLLEVQTDALLNRRFPASQRATLISVSSLCFSCVMIVLSPVMGYLFS